MPLTCGQVDWHDDVDEIFANANHAWPVGLLDRERNLFRLNHAKHIKKKDRIEPDLERFIRILHRN